MSKPKLVKLARLEERAKRTGRVQVRAEITLVWPDGIRITSTTGRPVYLIEFFDDFKRIYKAALAKDRREAAKEEG